MTIPDQALTVPQIMERNKRGLTVNMARQAYYELDENDQGFVQPDLNKMDYAEIQQLKADTAAQIQQMQLDLQEQNQPPNEPENAPGGIQTQPQLPASQPAPSTNTP